MGVARLDPYFAQSLCQQYNINRGKGQKQKHPREFLLYQPDVIEQPITVQDFKTRLMSQLRA